MAGREIQPAVYVMVNWRNGTFYVGHTADLPRRIEEHREGRGSVFTARHGIRRLVWYEFCDTLDDARRREGLIKRWRRRYKLDLIEEQNPEWRDLYHELA